MMRFDLTIRKTKEAVRRWTCFSHVNETTIIRDVYGKIALLFDLDASVSTGDKDSIRQSMEAELGNYFQGKIYYKPDDANDIVTAMIQEIERLRIPDDEDGKWYVLERAIAKKAWIDCSFEEQAIWPYEQAVEGAKPKVVTFYSFKGGMGRTTALAATALCLAKQGKHVLMIDTDVEAPGLASLFVEEGSVRCGVVDYLLECNLNHESIDMEDYLIQIADPVLTSELTGSLFVVPSGVIDADYLQKLARIDFQDTVPGSLKDRICRLIEDAVERIGRAYKIDYVLLDARAGFHDMGGIVTTQIPHGAVVFGKDSRQSWQGLGLVIRAISAMQQDRPLLAIVDGVCGQNGIVSAAEKKSFTDEAYTICSDVYYGADEPQPGIEAQDEAHSPIFVSYQPALSAGFELFTEGSVERDEHVEQLKSLLMGKEYQQICNRILQWFHEGVRE